MKFKNKIFIFFLLLFFFDLYNPSVAQSPVQGSVIIDGLVYGYNYEPSKKLLQKEKQIKVEGVLDNVTVDVLENGKIIKTTKTKSNGTFLIKVKTDKVYTLELSKPGYSSISITLDFTATPKDIVSKGFTFSGMELILNSFQPKNKSETIKPFGKLFYNVRGNYIDFEAAKFLSKKDREYISNPVSLMMRSVQKNKNRSQSNQQSADFITPEKDNSKTTIFPVGEAIDNANHQNYYDTINKIFSVLKAKTKNGFDKISDTDIQSLEQNIIEARNQFEKNRLNAHTPGDSLMLKRQENLLNSVESELLLAKKTIELQKDKISTQRQLLFLAIACVLLLSVLLFLIYRFSNEKKKIYILLKEKNKKITDSINYASRIQESVLPSDSEIKKQLPESFIYFQPRDIVSGDFYWLSTIREKIIIACVDCTGHGVPGAFMSLIGNTLLNEIVNEKQIVDASLILKRLHLEIVKALHQNTDRVQSKDGMELSLCVIDNNTKIIEFAGARNPLYIVKDDAIIEIKPDMKSIGGDGNDSAEIEFTRQIIQIQKNMSIYMFTDGYMDQFGGPENKKYNIPNFKKLLIEIQSLDMDKQKEIVEESLQKWKGDYKQIDDILVIGIRF